MTLRLVVQSSSPASASPYRLLDDQDRELTWANHFLDAQSIRQLSPRSVRAYAYDLLHFARWLPPDLIRREDFPPPDHYLPKPLSPEDDLCLDQQLRHTDDLVSNALLLIRATGVRIGEAVDLPLDCLRQISETQWALHVPLGKLHTERWVPVDDDTRRIVARMLELRTRLHQPRDPAPP